MANLCSWCREIIRFTGSTELAEVMAPPRIQPARFTGRDPLYSIEGGGGMERRDSNENVFFAHSFSALSLFWDHTQYVAPPATFSTPRGVESALGGRERGEATGMKDCGIGITDELCPSAQWIMEAPPPRWPRPPYCRRSCTIYRCNTLHATRNYKNSPFRLQIECLSLSFQREIDVQWVCPWICFSRMTFDVDRGCCGFFWRLLTFIILLLIKSIPNF